MVDTTSFNQLGSTSFISGLSGTNFSNLVKAEYQKDISAASIPQKRVYEQKQKLARYDQLSELVKNVQTIAEQLGEKTFLVKKTVMSADADKNVKVTLSDAAPFGRLSLKVLQTATAHKVASHKFANATNALSQAGKIHLKAGGAAGADITITNTMSLDEIAKTINTKTADTGVSAIVVKVSESEHRLVLSADKTNQKITINDKDGGNLSQSLGLLNVAGQVLNELSSPKPAKIELNGLTIERNANKISDVLPGVSLDLLNADSSKTIKIDIESNQSAIKKEITNFVEAYNKLRNFVLSQQATVAGSGAAAGAHLFGESILKNLSDSFYKELGGTVETGGIQYNLRSFGFSFNKDNTLKIDNAKLNKILGSKLEIAKNFFAGKGSGKGLGDRLKDALAQWNGSDNSVIDKERSSLNDQIKNYQSDISKITAQAQKRREYLITYYARLEQKISAAKLMVRQLEAITKANSSS